jgi:hypothetical protein
MRAGVICRKTGFGSQGGRGMRLIERFLTVAETCRKHETCRKQRKDLVGHLTESITAHRLRLPASALLA